MDAQGRLGDRLQGRPRAELGTLVNLFEDHQLMVHLQSFQCQVIGGPVKQSGKMIGELIKSIGRLALRITAAAHPVVM